MNSKPQLVVQSQYDTCTHLTLENIPLFAPLPIDHGLRTTRRMDGAKQRSVRAAAHGTFHMLRALPERPLSGGG